eukprot:365710-Chlamydomonas_euryale.AAC.4
MLWPSTLPTRPSLQEDGKLGYIVPTWVGPDGSGGGGAAAAASVLGLKCAATRISLPFARTGGGGAHADQLRSSELAQLSSQLFEDIDARLLLFLRKLRAIAVSDSAVARRKVMLRQDAPAIGGGGGEPGQASGNAGDGDGGSSEMVTLQLSCESNGNATNEASTWLVVKQAFKPDQDRCASAAANMANAQLKARPLLTCLPPVNPKP